MKQKELSPEFFIQSGLLSSFFSEIDQKLQNNPCYVDVVLDWCERNNIPMEMIIKDLQANTIALTKLKDSAQKLNFLKKARRIPI
jgi:hypothetical protein